MIQDGHKNIYTHHQSWNRENPVLWRKRVWIACAYWYSISFLADPCMFIPNAEFKAIAMSRYLQGQYQVNVITRSISSLSQVHYHIKVINGSILLPGRWTKPVHFFQNSVTTSHNKEPPACGFSSSKFGWKNTNLSFVLFQRCFIFGIKVLRNKFKYSAEMMNSLLSINLRYILRKR